MGICEGRVCIVTGAGRGIGREHALMLAAQGARVVVNDLGGSRDGTGADAGPAQQVVDEIVAAGGTAVANTDDVSSFDGAERMIRQAVDELGGLDVLVNNAGILRDRMLVNMTEAEWDSVITVHLKGTFAPAHFAAGYWRDRSKAGEPVNARIINTTSVSGIYGNAGQTNYGAAKAGIASFSFISSLELARYGVTVNAVAPVALTRLTADLGGAQPDAEVLADGPADVDDWSPSSPRWIAPLVCWLASEASAHVTGRVFEASATMVAVAEGWHRGPSAAPVQDPAAVGEIVDHLLESARAPADMNGADRA
ncbi:MAG TPA: SDR family oxidoreductase [Microthrixaceae bacterium]|nr:SDR family oxidoreductase [Microthrixaceae bacterium]